MENAASITTIPDGYMSDNKGRLVAVPMIAEFDMLEHQLVTTMMRHADQLSAQIARFKGHCFDDVGAFMELLASKYKRKKGGAKGNIQLTNFDGTMKVQLAVADQFTFGPELQIAKALIDDCINEWATDARAEIRTLVGHAFQVDSAGKVNRDAIFALRRLKIDDARWVEAMAAIADSIKNIGSKSYFRFYRRDHSQAQWRAITIDLASA